MADDTRTINDVADEARSIRVYLEPIQPPVSAPAGSSADPGEVFGVPVFFHPKGTDGSPLWYRVLGVTDVVDCNSTTFIIANLPDLISDPKCGLANVGYVEVSNREEIAYVEMNWGESLLERAKPCGCDAANQTALPYSQLIYRKQIASYRDSQQPAGYCGKFPHGHPRYKWLSHELFLEVYGPDVGDVQRCLQEASIAAALAGVAAAYGTAGAALPAAEKAFIEVFIACVGDSFSVPYPFPDESHWEFNC